MKCFLSLIALLIISITATAQCKIKFLVKDRETAKPLSGAFVYENDVALGMTGSDGSLFIVDHKAGFTSFTISKSSYEAWIGYALNVRPDTTVTSPPIYLNKLDQLQMMAIRSLKNNDAAESGMLFKRVTSSFDLYRDTTSKKKFLEIYRKVQINQRSSVNP